MNKRMLLLIFLVPFFAGCERLEEELEKWKDKDKPDEQEPIAENLLKNADFEEVIDFSLAEGDWVKAGWKPDLGQYEWAPDIGRNNSGGISLEAGGSMPNDIAIIQTVQLDPDKYYRASAWVKTEQVQDGKGASIGLYNTWLSSDGITGTSDWQQISFDFVPPASGEVVIASRLGHWSAVSSGKVYFDDLVLEEVEKYVEAGEYLRLVIDEEDAAVVNPETIENWIGNLDRAYEKYGELMGAFPYEGERITIQSVEAYPGGWAVAGNPILWHRPYVQEELRRIENTGSWSFGIMHELGHDFALQEANRSWIWNEEMFANLRMYYVVEELNAAIHQGSRVYTGSELKEYYKTDAGENYAEGIAMGIPQGHDGLMYTLIRIKDQVGWEPFRQSIQDLNASNLTPATRWESFNLFLDKLTHYSAQDVRATYVPGELETIEQLLKP